YNGDGFTPTNLSGDVTIDAAGTITSAGYGISGRETGKGDVNVTLESTGVLDRGRGGIFAVNNSATYNGNTTVTVNGKIFAGTGAGGTPLGQIEAYGVYASTFGLGDVGVQTGASSDIEAALDAIHAVSFGGTALDQSDVTVVGAGKIVSTGGNGILAQITSAANKGWVN